MGSKICEVTYCHLDFKKSTQRTKERLRAERKDATPMGGAGRAVRREKSERRHYDCGAAGIRAPG